MQYSRNGQQLTEQFEGCQLVAYQDSVDRWTIGYGHTGPEVHEGLVWNQAQADAQLLIDIQWAASVVNRVVTVALSQGEFDALTDLVFNIGSGNFETSTMLKLLNAGDYQGAASWFDKWDRSGGQVVAGLLRRRAAETQEFEGVQA